MCTAVTYKTNDFYFGRNLDYEISFGEKIVIIPRNFEFKFLDVDNIKNHYAIIGMACVQDNYPLLYDAANEKGLAAAGLNFVGNAKYNSKNDSEFNIAQFEFIPWILSKCANVDEAVDLIKNTNITNKAFSEELAPAELHWIIADKNKCITVESTADGIKIFENSIGILTNNPTFDKQMSRLNDYIGLSPYPPQNIFSENFRLTEYSRGMGAIGLPGDLSSQSRFVRAAFVKLNSLSGNSENESVVQFFHILTSVEQQRGCCRLKNNKNEFTLYKSCINTNKGIYYYSTYENPQICAVKMISENLEQDALIIYPMLNSTNICEVN